MDGLTPKDEQKIIKSITWTVSLEDLLDYKSISGQRLNKKLFSA